MINVYDLIEELYIGDEGWEFYLKREYAEGFIRSEAYRGASDKALIHIWTQVVILCIYAGNASILLGDLSQDDFVDCVAWCGRNVSGFQADYRHVSYFLNVCQRLLKYLAGKKAIYDASAATLGKKKLLYKGQVLLVNPDGSFQPDGEGYQRNATPDLEVKIFINISDKMKTLLTGMQKYFGKTDYQPDLDRSSFLYYGILPDMNGTELPQDEDENECYWDYFFFDYHLIKDARTPLVVYYEQYKELHPQPSLPQRAVLDLLEALLQAKLLMFTIKSFSSEEDAYECQDFLTHKIYYITMPIDITFDTKEMVFLGHVLPDGSVINSYIRCLRIGLTAQKRMLELLSAARNWYSVQKPEARDWQVFIADNTILLLHLALAYSNFYMLGAFSRPCKVQLYTPAPLVRQHPITQMLMALMTPLHFPYRDKQLLLNLWSDFQHKDQDLQEPEFFTWAIALLYEFIKLNKTYQFSIKDYAGFAELQEKDILHKTQLIEEKLQIEEFDPRYVNEEGLLLLAMS